MEFALMNYFSFVSFMKNMDVSHVSIGHKDEDICLIDSATTHTILKDRKYFSHIRNGRASVNTIAGNTRIIEGSGRAIIILPKGTQFFINDALYSPKSQRNLLSFKDIRQNGYHVETINEKSIEYLHITNVRDGEKCVLEKLPTLSSGLYYTSIKSIESNAIVSQKLADKTKFIVWHDRLGISDQL